MDSFHTEQILKELKYISAFLTEARDPIDITVMASSTQPWIVDYHNRKHIFIWLPTAQSLQFDDYGTGAVQAQVWMNIGMPQGTRMFIPTSPSLVEFMVRFTDEVIP